MLLIILGKALAVWKSCGLLAILVRAMYKAALKTITPIIIKKLNEKMMINNEARIATIINANKEIGNPKMTARFLMFL